MHTGMLWFDNDPHTALVAKIERAVDYYRQKYGRVPDLWEVDGRRLVFGVEAHDGFELISKGRQERFIIKKDKFNSKMKEKTTKKDR